VLADLPCIELSTWFSLDDSQAAKAGDEITQFIRIKNPFQCECILAVESHLVDSAGRVLSTSTLCYDGNQTSFEERTVVGRRPRHSRRRGRRSTATPNPPNPRNLERQLTVGLPPQGVARPHQVFANVSAKATEANNQQASKEALWEDGLEAQASVLIT
jgi:hypothetical protein